MAAPTHDNIEVEVRSRADLRDWLDRNHSRGEGIWLVHHKKSSPHYLPMGDIVAECLAHGWVDSLVRRKDDQRSMHWIAPRKKGSNWSATNKKLAAELEAKGLMTDAGRAVIVAAKSDGSWSRLDAADRLEMPQDLERAFSSRTEARANWTKLPGSEKRNDLKWILTAKRPDTRQRRIDEVVGRAERSNGTIT